LRYAIHTIGLKMKGNRKGKKKGKYADELKKLQELNAIKEVLKKSDIENAALTNTSKDSETVSDNVIDNMLNQLNLDRNANKDLEIVENLSSKAKNGASIVKSSRIKIKHTPKGVNVKSKVHVIKRAGARKKGKSKKR
jgi:hypothetical protein